jgi:hypothetical protein
MSEETLDKDAVIASLMESIENLRRRSSSRKTTEFCVEFILLFVQGERRP